MKKAQISVEILFSIGFVIFIFIILLAFTMERRQEVRETETTLEEKSECHKLSNLISGVYTAGEGTGLIETLEYDVDIDVDERSITVGDFLCRISISSIDSPSKLCEGSITLNHTNGVVELVNFEGITC